MVINRNFLWKPLEKHGIWLPLSVEWALARGACRAHVGQGRLQGNRGWEGEATEGKNRFNDEYYTNASRLCFSRNGTPGPRRQPSVIIMQWREKRRERVRERAHRSDVKDGKQNVAPENPTAGRPVVSLQLFVPLDRLLVRLRVEIDEAVEVDAVAAERLNAEMEDFAESWAWRHLDAALLQEQAQHVIHLALLHVAKDAVHVVHDRMHGIVFGAVWRS